MHQLHHASGSPSPSHVFLYCLTLAVTLAYMVWSPTVQIAGWSNRKGPTIIFAFAIAASRRRTTMSPRTNVFFALYSHPFWCPTLAWQLRARLHGWHAAHCTRETSKKNDSDIEGLLFATANTDKEWQEVRPAVLCPKPREQLWKEAFLDKGTYSQRAKHKLLVVVLSFPHDSCSAKHMVQAFHLWHGCCTTLPRLSALVFHSHSSQPQLYQSKNHNTQLQGSKETFLCAFSLNLSAKFSCAFCESSLRVLAWLLNCKHCVLTIYLLFPVCCVIVSMSACWKQVGRTRSTLRSRMELVKGTSHTVESCAECFFFEIWPV